MFPSDEVNCQLLSVVQGVGPEFDAYSRGLDLDFSIHRFTVGRKVYDA